MLIEAVVSGRVLVQERNPEIQAAEEPVDEPLDPHEDRHRSESYDEDPELVSQVTLNFFVLVGIRHIIVLKAFHDCAWLVPARWLEDE